MFKIVVLVTLLTGEPFHSMVSNASFPSLQACDAELDKGRELILADVIAHFGKHGLANEIKVEVKCEFRK